MPTAARAIARRLAATGLAGLLLLGAQVRAGDVETRDFSISVDRKPAGSYRMRIVRSDDGTVQMEGTADVHLRVLVVNYTYSFRGVEAWKDDCLLGLSSRCNDDGKPFAVTAARGVNGLTVTANGQSGMLPADAWVSTYWRLPAARLRGQSLTILDADTGRALRGTLRLVGRETVRAAGRLWPCDHYQLPELNVDLWFDAAERLVRQEYPDSGRRVVLELRSVRR